MQVPFTKMHGLGNDFIILDNTLQKLTGLVLDEQLIQSRSDRNFGVGFDQLLVIDNAKNPDNDFAYRIYNADGSEVEMCGNGIRCFAKYVVERGLTDNHNLKVETMAGVMSPTYSQGLIKVNMGKPKFETELKTVNSSGSFFEYLSVNMGNPHAVIFLDETIKDFEVEKYGKPIENNLTLFPGKTNVEFVYKISDSELEMRVWERGTGETLACGTGACATGVAGILSRGCDRDVVVHLRGGDLRIERDGGVDDVVWMTGPAEFVFDGVLEV